MKKLIITIVFYFFGHVIPAQADIINYLVIERQAEPFQIQDGKGAHSGIITDITREIFKGSDHQINIISQPYKNLQRMVEAGEVNNWLTYGATDWSAPGNINLTENPIFNIRQELLVPKKFGFQFSGIESLLGKTLILIVGFDYPGIDEYIARGEINAVRMTQYKKIFMELLFRDRFTGYLELNTRLDYQLMQVEKPGGRIMPEDFYRYDLSAISPGYDIYFARDPRMPNDIQTLIENRIVELHQDGTIEQILDRYR
ncbi:ABC transporter substrate-binding protein [Oceanicoccus sp. KOV_DT_Chl]|uniref:substrate-binding periplasmic protein n=1 Tax=Oceanicoccus sp. KOV_DT_Chl TaxID=1904639 RepID=UPI000C7AF936|nr:transporter substrate-binding domain-containing protein [Oceanicoccus sp. KOV_DT_Chl]